MRTICIFLLRYPRFGRSFPAPEAAADRNPLAGSPEAVAAGKKLFADSCSGCHGANGEGGRGPNLAEGRRIRRLIDKALFTSIRSGVPGTDMPPTNLPDTQIWQWWRSSATWARLPRRAGCRAIRTPARRSSPARAAAKAATWCTAAAASRTRPDRHRRATPGAAAARIDRQAQRPDRRRIRGRPRDHRSTARRFPAWRGTTTITRSRSWTRKVSLHLLSKDKLRSLTFRKTSLMPEDYGKRLLGGGDREPGGVFWAARPCVRRRERAPDGMRGGRR